MAKIRPPTARISMFLVVILIFLTALTLQGVNLSGFEIPSRVAGLILLSAVLIAVVEIGVKRLTPLSDLKRLEPKQYVSLFISAIVLIVAIGLLFGIPIPFLITFAPGLLFLEGLVILLEIFI